VGVVVVFRDVTERVNLEQRLALSERLASIGTLAAGMGHEINNPLTYVTSNVEFSRQSVRDVIGALRDPKRDDEAIGAAVARLEELSDALRDAEDGVDRVRRIVRDLKTFTRVEEGTAQIVDLSEVLETATRMMEHALRHHAKLRKWYGTTPLVEANEGQLTQVFMNLLSNASDAIGEGDAERHEISVRSYTDAEGRAVVEIHDTGHGIPAHVIPRIFDPFFTTKSVGAGMGLGLAICHNVIASFRGEITAESRAGEGTTFRVTLPPVRRSSGTTRVARPVATPPSRRGRVLVIDDEAAVATAIARILGTEHDVTTETDARAALVRIASGEKYDVIFCDLMMPNLSGIDVYQALLSSAPDLARRIVFITGGAFSARARAFLEQVDNASICKPFTLESIRAIVGDRVGPMERKTKGN
jgi:nitrogen-specific signal transduction histidine kinase/CheY-like chemotaxis protein